MTRLTNDMRGEIVNAVMFHKYNEPAVAMVRRLTLLADDVYKDVLSCRERDLIDQLPKDWLVTDTHVYIHVENLNSYQIYFAGIRYTDDLIPFLNDDFEIEYRRIPYKFKGNVWKVYEPDNILICKVIETFEDKKELIKEINADRKRLTATIDKFTTVEKLIDAWPEVEKFVPEQKKPIKLPALPVEELNRQFNLP